MTCDVGVTYRIGGFQLRLVHIVVRMENGEGAARLIEHATMTRHTGGVRLIDTRVDC